MRILRSHTKRENEKDRISIYGHPFVLLTDAFMRLVDRLLSFRQDVHSPNIKKFCLRIHSEFDTSRVNGWISTVLRHKVEEIALVERKCITYPPSLFTCESLVILKIYNVFLNLPESVNLPKLKILRLNVSLSKNDEHLIQKCLSNSPFLEELSLAVYKSDIQYLSIFGPNLKRLSFDCSHRNFEIQVNAPNLQSFNYSYILAKDFLLHNFCSLLDAEIVLLHPTISRSFDQREKHELGSLATKLFASLSNVKRLTVSGYSLKLLSYQNHFTKKLPSFNNLIHLELVSASWHLAYGPRDELPIVLDFLHMSPNLESLIFAYGFRSDGYNSNDSWSPDLVPQCLLLNLKSIEFCGFYGKQIEMDLLKLFLKNAKVLQTVTITISDAFSPGDWVNKKQLKKDISLLPRSSDECVLYVSY